MDGVMALGKEGKFFDLLTCVEHEAGITLSIPPPVRAQSNTLILPGSCPGIVADNVHFKITSEGQRLDLVRPLKSILFLTCHSQIPAFEFATLNNGTTMYFFPFFREIQALVGHFSQQPSLSQESAYFKPGEGFNIKKLMADRNINSELLYRQLYEQVECAESLCFHLSGCFRMRARY